MYKILEVTIDGFWSEFKVHGTFKDDVNIVIGKNGSGKTTFMNILHAVLAVDIDALYENDFQVVTIKLHNGKNIRTVKAVKGEYAEAPFPRVEYQISTKKYNLPIISNDDRSFSPSLRRRAFEESRQVRAELNRLVSLASLSVYRIGVDSDPDARERPSKRIISPVDMRLSSLLQLLTHYQLDLSNQARAVSTTLQRDVLISLLYESEILQNSFEDLDFDENVERKNLISAYKQLGVSGSDVSKKISDHTSAISKTINSLKSYKGDDELNFELAPLEARKRTRRVIEMSLLAEKKTTEIFSQITDFLATIKDFIPEKKFEFVVGELQINGDDIPVERLSSGEKQLLILFVESLLQKHKPFVFLADEPELSLHISWQRKIISAIRKLNPRAQIIVATHSPEIAGKFSDRIMDMEDMLHV